MNDDRHWLSDVVAGAALGVLVGRQLTGGRSGRQGGKAAGRQDGTAGPQGGRPAGVLAVRPLIGRGVVGLSASF
jgi:hypothetical protein